MPALMGDYVYMHTAVWVGLCLLCFSFGIFFTVGLQGLNAYRHEQRIRRIERAGRRRKH